MKQTHFCRIIRLTCYSNLYHQLIIIFAVKIQEKQHIFAIFCEAIFKISRQTMQLAALASWSTEWAFNMSFCSGSLNNSSYMVNGKWYCWDNVKPTESHTLTISSIALCSNILMIYVIKCRKKWYSVKVLMPGWRGGLVVSVLDQRLRGRGFELRWLRAIV